LHFSNKKSTITRCVHRNQLLHKKFSFGNLNNLNKASSQISNTGSFLGGGCGWGSILQFFRTFWSNHCFICLKASTPYQRGIRSQSLRWQAETISQDLADRALGT
jgi:hypothetical protein